MSIEGVPVPESELTGRTESTRESILRTSDAHHRAKMLQKMIPGITIKLDFKPGLPADTRLRKTKSADGTIQTMSALSPATIHVEGPNIDNDLLDRVENFLKTGEDWIETNEEERMIT